PSIESNMARRQGATREHFLYDLGPRRNAGAGPFSTQPSGPQFFGRISASLARPVSQWIQALRSLLEIRPNSSRRLASHTGYTTLVGLLLRRCLFLLVKAVCPRKVSYESRSEPFGPLASQSDAEVRRAA